MKLWRWEYGRQGSGYRKLTLAFSKRLKFDAYILHLPEGVRVPPHQDPCPAGYEHHRFNLTLKASPVGGVTFAKEDGRWQKMPRSYVFRPDQREHFVTRTRGGGLWLLSIGWLKSAT